MKKSTVWINLIGCVILIALLLIGISEADKYVNKIDWPVTEVYEMCNQHIEWTH